MWKIEGGGGGGQIHVVQHATTRVKRRTNEEQLTFGFTSLFPLLTRRLAASFLCFFSAAYIFLGRGTMCLSLFPRGSVSADCGSQ